MKIVKIIVVCILTAGAVYLLYTHIPSIITQNAEFKAKVLVEKIASEQKQKVAKGIFEKTTLLAGLTKSIENKSLEEIKGAFDGNLTQFASLKYFSDPQDAVPKVSAPATQTAEPMYTVNENLPRKGYIEAKIDINKLVDPKFKDKVKLYQKPPAAQYDKNIIKHTVEIGETGWFLEASEKITPDFKMLYAATGSVLLLGLFALFSILFGSAGASGFGSLAALMDQVKSGNDDLRFELYEKDNAYHDKERINEFLDYVFDRIHAGEESVKSYKVLMQALVNSVRDSVLKKQLHYFTQALLSHFTLSQYHIFIKEDKNIQYINSEGETIFDRSSEQKLDEYIASANRTLSEQIDILSLVGKESGTYDNYIVYPLQDFGIVAVPKDLFDPIDSGLFEQFTGAMAYIMKSGTDKMSVLREKVLFEKFFARIPIGVLWVDKNGAVKRSNPEMQQLFALNDDITGTMVGKFFHTLGMDFSPVAHTLNSQTPQQSGAEVTINGVVKNISYTTAVIPVSNTGEFETVIVFREVGQSSDTQQIAELHSIIEKKTAEIAALSGERDSLREHTSVRTHSDAALTSLISVLSQSVVRGAKIINGLIEKSFDEEEKKFLDAVRKEMLHVNFAVKNYILADSKVTLENNEPSDFTMLLKRAFETFKLDYGKKRIALSVQLEKDIGMYPFDKTYIGMVLYNIFKVSHELLNQEGFMTITARKVNNRLGFSVDLKNCISRELKCASREETKDYIDLYLYVVNMIIQKHNGEVTVNAKDTTVSIAFTI